MDAPISLRLGRNRICLAKRYLYRDFHSFPQRRILVAVTFTGDCFNGSSSSGTTGKGQFRSGTELHVVVGRDRFHSFPSNAVRRFRDPSIGRHGNADRERWRVFCLSFPFMLTTAATTTTTTTRLKHHRLHCRYLIVYRELLLWACWIFPRLWCYWRMQISITILLLFRRRGRFHLYSSFSSMAIDD